MSGKPLGVVKNIVEAVGMDISCAYEDLVFLDHNGFLLQFTDNDRELLVHTNSEADRAVVDRDIDRLATTAREHDIELRNGSLYTLSRDDDENIRIEFHAAA